MTPADTVPGTRLFAARVLADEEAADRLFLRIVNAREQGLDVIGVSCDELLTLASELWALAGIAREFHKDAQRAD